MTLISLKLPITEKLTLPSVPVSFLQCSSVENCALTCDDYPQKPMLSTTSVLPASVKQASLLTKGSDVKHKIEIFLDVEDFNYSYLPGDTIGILPINPSSEVEDLIDCLDKSNDSSKPFSITVLPNTTKKNASVPKHLPSTTTLVDVLSKYLEIRTPVKKLLLRSLCCCTTDDKERRRLEELCSKECAEDYTKFILSDNITMLSLLKSFSSCKPSISLLLEHLPPIKPRIYSVASSQLIHGNQLRIVVTLVENDTGLKGVCSGYLYDFITASSDLEQQMKQLNIGDSNAQINLKNKVSMYFRQPNSFRYPDDPSTNLILVGPGSGVAPFIGFLEHKKALKNTDSSSQVWLFFGCRNENDYIFKNELSEFLSSGMLTKLFVSFSRAAENNLDSSKYVQDSIACVKEEFVDLLMNHNTLLFICGDARNMVKDVLATIKSCLQLVKGMEESLADNKVKDFCKSGTIVTDSWI